MHTYTKTISVDWHEGSTDIVVMTFAGKVSSEVFHEATRTAYRLIASRDHIVHLIIRPANSRPGTNLLSNFNKVRRTQPLNTGRIVIIDPAEKSDAVTGMIHQLAVLVTSAFPNRSPVLFAKDYNHAIRLLTAT